MVLEIPEEHRKIILELSDDFYFQEVSALYAGLREGIYHGVEDTTKAAETVEKLNKLGFSVESWEERNQISLAITRKKNLAQKIMECRNKKYYKKLGEILGYPKCCSKNASQMGLRAENYPYSLRGDFKISFEMNTMFNAESFTEDFNYSNLYEFTSDVSEEGEFFISHVPCSLHCERTRELAGRTRKIIERNFPRKAERFEKDLKKGFLVFGPLKFLFFDYKQLDGFLEVGGVKKTPLVDEEKLKVLEKTRTMELKGGEAITEYGRIKYNSCLLFN